MDPARSLGPEIVSGDFLSWWIYVVGLFAGGLVAASSLTCCVAPTAKRREKRFTGVEDRTRGRLTDQVTWAPPAAASTSCFTSTRAACHADQ
ncbi:MAG: aquaporin [Actinomycetota bacterium]|nr:aquaporin [Actinomycetota bacterium]